MLMRLLSLAGLLLLAMLLATAAPATWDACMAAAKAAEGAGKREEAIALVQAAIPFANAFAVTDDRVLESYLNLDRLYLNNGQTEKRPEIYTQLLARFEREYGVKDPRIATHLYAKAKAAGPQLDWKAEPLFRWALAAKEKEVGPNDLALVDVLQGLADVYDRSGGQVEKAAPLMRRSLAIQEAAYGPDDPRLVFTLRQLGNMVGRKNFAEGCALYRRMLDIVETRMEPDDPRAMWALYYAGSQYQWYYVKYPEAMLLQQRIMAYYEQSGQTNQDYYEIAMRILRDLYYALGYYSEAEALIQQKLTPYYARRFGKNGWGISANNRTLGLIYLRQQRPAEAEAQFLLCLEQTRATAGKNPNKEYSNFTIAEALLDLADCYQQIGKSGDAQKTIEEAKGLLAKTNYVSNSYIALTGGRAKGTPKETEESLLSSVRRQEDDAPNHWRMADAYLLLASCYRAQQRPDEAAIYFQKALDVWVRLLGPTHRALVPHLSALAASRLASNAPAEAATHYQRALTLAEEAYGTDARLLLPLLDGYAAALRALGREAEAAPVAARAAELRRNAR